MADEQNLVFVTVGTTSFDRLVETASSPTICEVFKRLGYKKLLLQIGRGEFEPETCSTGQFTVEYYRYKESIADDIRRASLVISHAGSGTTLEALQAGRHLIVVINEDLMGNHQFELAKQLAKDNHLYYSTCSSLQDVLEDQDLSNLVPFPPGNPKVFGSYMNSVMGLSDK
ncbi:UDP-N-acetylglucosamine transferase subunit ALG13 homolog [Exaiptasia diaphana]|uniref:UDP-N-acetylglucosamine transferase subunit ALG13 n=1 Tax=Exaiptasia diaphana TaxID=2652724 RepID=A0A913XAF1_EXADI|nr:UDP-N-acetylglucosamine transferase subunit ALG13 homolog [Exaiptasia diaphana]KXJ13617.1 UDP-N-acetylglucosamine transferase subunit ALG13-like [Exaiptasia diaphana]